MAAKTTRGFLEDIGAHFSQCLQQTEASLLGADAFEAVARIFEDWELDVVGTLQPVEPGGHQDVVWMYSAGVLAHLALDRTAELKFLIKRIDPTLFERNEQDFSVRPLLLLHAAFSEKWKRQQGAGYHTGGYFSKLQEVTELQEDAVGAAMIIRMAGVVLRLERTWLLDLVGDAYSGLSLTALQSMLQVEANETLEIIKSRGWGSQRNAAGDDSIILPTPKPRPAGKLKQEDVDSQLKQVSSYFVFLNKPMPEPKLIPDVADGGEPMDDAV